MYTDNQTNKIAVTSVHIQNLCDKIIKQKPEVSFSRVISIFIFSQQSYEVIILYKIPTIRYF